MKYIVLLLFIASLSLIFTGIYFDMNDEIIPKNKYYGYGTTLLFIVTMPLFLFVRFRKKFIEAKKKEELEKNQ